MKFKTRCIAYCLHKGTLYFLVAILFLRNFIAQNNSEKNLLLLLKNKIIHSWNIIKCKCGDFQSSSAM